MGLFIRNHSVPALRASRSNFGLTLLKCLLCVGEFLTCISFVAAAWQRRALSTLTYSDFLPFNWQED